MIKIIPHNRLTYDEADAQAVSEVVRSGYWAGGPQLAQLETLLATRSQTTYAFGVSAGLSALRLALNALGVRLGDTVIIPAYSCVALANAVLALGAQPVPVDVDQDWNIDPDAVADAVTPETRAIIAVHTFGLPASISRLRRYGLPIVEDCAHAFGISVNEKPLGSLGDLAILSFYATKLMGAGEGGGILTANTSYAEHIRTWRDYSDQPPNGTRLNDKMNDLEAALAIGQLRRLDAMITSRQRLSETYHNCLATLEAQTGLFRLPIQCRERVWYRYVIEMTTVTASHVVTKLRAKGIHADQPVYDWHQQVNIYPKAAENYTKLVSLPLYPTLGQNEQQSICNEFIQVVKEIGHK